MAPRSAGNPPPTRAQRQRSRNNSQTQEISSEEEDVISEGDTSEDVVVITKRRKIVKNEPKKLPLPRISSEEELQWIDKYSPTNSGEICTNPRKLKEVKEVMSDLIFRKDRDCRLLILTGPAGSCKSTTAKVLANELIGERNSNLIGTNDGGRCWDEYLDTIVSNMPQPRQFSEFLQDCKYKVGSNLSVIIVEELPNIFHPQTLQYFRQAISEWIYTDERIELPPLVLCLTEIELRTTHQEYFNIDNNLTIETLLGKSFLSAGKLAKKIKQIKFNPVAPSFVKKTINKIISKEPEYFLKINKNEVTKFLSKIQETGDIRSIISNLQLWAKLKSKSVFNVELTNQDDFFLRENQISLFHAIGKIIYSSTKFESIEDPEMVDYLTVEAVLKNYSNNELLSLSLLENYHIYNNSNYDISIASEIVDKLSLNDVMSSVPEGREIGFRGCRNQLRKIEKTSTIMTSIKFPRQFKMIRQFRQTENEIYLYLKWCNEFKTNFNNLNLIDGYYLPLIYNKRNTTPYRYNRLGGRFQPIFADDNLPVMEEEQGNWTQDQFKIDIENNISQGEQLEQEEMSESIEDSEDEEEESFFDDSFDDDAINEYFNERKWDTQDS